MSQDANRRLCNVEHPLGVHQRISGQDRGAPVVGLRLAVFFRLDASRSNALFISEHLFVMEPRTMWRSARSVSGKMRSTDHAFISSAVHADRHRRSSMAE